MKILQINKYFYPRSGSDIYMVQTSELLQKRGHDVLHFAMKTKNILPTPYLKYFVDNIEYENELNSSILRKLHVGFKIIYSMEARRKLLQLIDDEKPDIAHVHKFNNTLTPSILYALKEKGIPVLHTAHDYRTICPNYNLYDFNGSQICEDCMGHKYFNAVKRRCQKSSYLIGLNIAIESYLYHFLKTYENHIDLYVSASSFLKAKMITFGVEADRIVHIPLYIFADQYDSGQNNANYILYFGRIEKHKGLETLMRSMKHVKSSVLYIAGQGSYLKELLSLQSRLSVENVKFLGYMSGEDLKNLIEKALFTVVPSEWYEPFGLVIIESFASGRPVIGADIGGISELIDDGTDGLLFEPGNAELLADRINYLLSNRKLLEEMGRNARKKVEEKYNPGLHYERLMEAYRQVM